MCSEIQPSFDDMSLFDCEATERRLSSGSGVSGEALPQAADATLARRRLIGGRAADYGVASQCSLSQAEAASRPRAERRMALESRLASARDALQRQSHLATEAHSAGKAAEEGLLSARLDQR